MRFILLLFYSLLIFSCSTTVNENSDMVKIESENGNFGLESDYEEEIECEDDEIPCEALSLWVSESFDEGDFEESINNANQAIACNCSVSNAAEIYSGLARSYAELEEDDKASNAIKKGLSYEPENIELIELAIWNANRLKQVDDEISSLELLLTIDKSVDFFKRLSDVYRRERRYNDQVRIIKKWLESFPNDSNANAELKLAYNKLGKDEFAIDKERCEKNPDNFDFCFTYSASLANSARYQEALIELNKMLKRYPSNEKLIKKTADVYLDNYNQNDALALYKKLFKMKGSIEYAMEISKIYQDLEKYGNAHKWGKKALNISNSNSEALFNYAQLFKNSVEACSEENLSLEDKAVYEISYKYYRLAYKQGNKESKNMINWFKSNKKSVLPTLEDWFLIETDKNELRPIEINPKKTCYSWVEQSVDRIGS
jgi:tetratricopeptide (TPR) repeat protein